MNLRKIVFVAVSLALGCWAGRSFADGAEGQPGSGAGRGTPALGLVGMGGLAVPVCRGQQGCDGHLGLGPSVGALVLYAPNETWAIGAGFEAARIHWRESYVGMTDGQTYQLDADLTAGFAALAMRYTPFPGQSLSPIVHAAVGAGFQSQTGTNFHCNDGLIPTTQIGIGLREQVSADLSLFGLASARWGFKLSDCGVSDGPGATPFAGWGFGLHAGVAFDVAL